MEKGESERRADIIKEKEKKIGRLAAGQPAITA